MLIADALTVKREGRLLLAGVSLQARPGEVHVILGPNGAGKSTLLRILSGDLRADAGQASLDGRPLASWPLRELARRRAVLPQQDSLRFSFTATEVVALGRMPFADSGLVNEQGIIEEALAATGVQHLAQRRYPTLSGGERARVQLARVLAQLWPQPQTTEARYLLLDEPTASLDLAHQYACLRQMRRFATDGGGVVAVLHDPNQALAVADRVSLLLGGRLMASGTPADVLTPDRLSALYEVPLEVHLSHDGHRIIGVARDQLTR